MNHGEYGFEEARIVPEIGGGGNNNCCTAATHKNEQMDLSPRNRNTAAWKNTEERQAANRQLFKTHIPESSFAEIRDAINKAWVLGNDRFEQRIQKQMERRIKGGFRIDGIPLRAGDSARLGFLCAALL